MAVSGIHDDDDDIGTLHACAWPAMAMAPDCFLRFFWIFWTDRILIT